MAATRADKFVGFPGAVAMVAVGTGVSVGGMGVLVAVDIGVLVADGTGVSVGTGVLVAGGVHFQTSVLAGTGTTLNVEPSLWPAAHRFSAVAWPLEV